MSRGSRIRGRGTVAASVALLAVVVFPQASLAGEGGRPVKQLLTGVMDREGPPPARLAGVMDTYALHLHWKNLQPRAGGRLATRGLDRALNAAAEDGERVKLRVLTGVQSPDWAKRLGGPPVHVTNPANGQYGTVPRFWTRRFGAAYAELQRRLAGRYDDSRVVAEVAISRCTLFYAEPFLRHAWLGANRSALVRAGYTPRADKACHRQEIDAHRVWSRTRSGLALNPAQLVGSSGRIVVDDRFTARMMAYCRNRLHGRCILENLSIRSPISGLDPDPRRPHYRRMYRAMKAQGPPVAFQTATAARMGNCSRTLEWAIDMRAAYVELPRNPHAAGCSWETMVSADRRLR